MKTYAEGVEYQEIIAALLLPGPDGKNGWNVRELSAVCPSVREPHRASQLLYDLSKIGVTHHVGRGISVRHYLHDNDSCHALLKQSGKDKWYPSRALLDALANQRERVFESLKNQPKGGAHVQQWIWEAWEDPYHPAPLTKKQILQAIRRKHACSEHVVSQQLYAMTQSGKLRQHEETGKAIAFVPVHTPDLFSMADAQSRKAEPKASSYVNENEGVTKEIAVPKVINLTLHLSFSFKEKNMTHSL